jgi:hypothetical protein
MICTVFSNARISKKKKKEEEEEDRKGAGREEGKWHTF